jgi:tryptophan halogenase
VDLPSALMAHGKVFARNPSAGGGPDVQGWHGFHIENHLLIKTLEVEAIESGVTIIDGTVDSVERGEQGVASLHLKDGRRFTADLYVDASGFRSELLGRAMEEPFVDFDKALFCDRAVVGGWERTNEPILPYTTAETMDCGWSWQIEHERHINRGYVYSSQAISDDDAAAEFKRKNPKTPDAPRVVKFRSGHYRRMWVDNVVAIGNSGGFVEPLEATALMVVCSECQDLIECLGQCALVPTPSIRKFYNNHLSAVWSEIRDFLALHYKFNTRLDTPFWQHCRADTDVSRLADFFEFYDENGPTGLARYSLPREPGNFGVEGYLVMMVGNRVPYKGRHQAVPGERQLWDQRRRSFAAQALQSYDVKQALAITRDPRWTWNSSAARN